MYETHIGMIYGFIGPIGGGKTYQLELLRKRNKEILCPFITGDFSDGIRQTVLNLFGCDGLKINASSGYYLEWKNKEQLFDIPIGDYGRRVPIKGRELLKNIGEGLKDLAGQDVWARWTLSDICKQYQSLPNDNRKQECDVAFGSIRFKDEAQVVFNASEMLEKQVKLIFCNFHEVKYDPDVHVSESLAHKLISLGYKDEDDVTQAVKKIYNIK